jgi:hypothetical protein
VHPFLGRWFDEAIVASDSRRARFMDALLFALLITILALLFLWGLRLASKG